MTEDCRGAEEEVKEGDEEEEWTAVLSLDHIRSLNRYVSLLERWARQLQLAGRLLLGRSILVILQGARPNIKVPKTHMFNTASHSLTDRTTSSVRLVYNVYSTYTLCITLTLTHHYWIIVILQSFL